MIDYQHDGAARRRGHWGRRGAPGRALALSAMTGLIAVGLLASTPASAAPTVTTSNVAAAAAVRAARVANAQAHSAHSAGAHGGSGHGKAIGRSTAARSATPPVPTAVERQQLKAIAARPVFTPKQRQGTNAPAFPKSPAQAAATSLAAANGSAGGSRPGAPRAPSDFNLFRATNLTATIPSSFASNIDEPSVANDGNNVLYTGNWYAATSTDSGATFSYIDPYTLGPAPTLPNGGFCCDQVAIHSPSANDITAWGLLYCNVDCTNGAGDNLIRLAVARNQTDLGNGTFDYYDFSAQTFGFGEGDWLDYPHFGLGANSLYLSMNVFNGQNFVHDLMIRFDLSAFATGSWQANWYFNNQDFTWTSTDTSADTFGYWAATQFGDGGLVRVYNWPEGTDFTHVGWNDFSPRFNSETRNGSCPAPDGLNWCARNDSRVKTGGEVGVSTVYFMWDAAQGGGFPFPYTDWASFDVSTGPATSMSENQIYTLDHAFQYPGLGIDAAGNLGVSIAAGGGAVFPVSEFLFADDLTGPPTPFTAVLLGFGSHSSSDWGDYLTARPATYPGSTGNTWIMSGYVLGDDGLGNAVTEPSFYWAGRQRDDPFAPQSVVGFLNDPAQGGPFTEGRTDTVNTGSFYGPSNCTCDYRATNDWGDLTADAASISQWPGNPPFFILAGTHDYGEEGSYTTTVSVSDFWNGFGSANGLSRAKDANVDSAGTTLTGTAGRVVSGVVATFSDADPGATTSDYSAAINWGDSTTSPGSIGSGFTVSGSHTYARPGMYTITVSILDVGGFDSAAMGTANIGPLAPKVTSVSSNAGRLAGGQTVTINGTNFTGATAVKFGTTPATTYTVVNATTITAVTPARPAGTVDVRVTTAFGTTAIVAADHYTYQAAPAVSSVSPSKGPVAGGLTVTIHGTNFTGATAVKFGTSAATSFTVVNATTITAKTPARTAGVVDVRVTTTSGISPIAAADHYTYVAAPKVASVSPTNGTHVGGQTVTVTGTGFTGATSVQLGTASATTFTVVSDTKITVTTPAHGASTVDVRVTTPGGTSAVVVADHYKFT